MGDQIHCPFLVSRKCNLGKHAVRHEFLYLYLIALGFDRQRLVQTKGTDNF
jgi:hypothetical protein